MIVPMLKTYVVCRAADRGRLLEALRDLGVLHLVPVDPARAVPDEQTLAALDRLRRAGQVLQGVEPAGPRPELDPQAAAEEVLAIQRRAAEGRARLAALHQQIRQLAEWGEMRLEQLEALREAGIEVKFYSVPSDSLAALDAECVQPLGERPGDRVLVAVVDRRGEVELPGGAEPVEPPARDRPGLRAEADQIDRDMQAGEQRLATLAHLAEEMDAARARLEEQAQLLVATGSGLKDEALFAVQGWIPAPKADALAEGLAATGIPAGLRTRAPAEDDRPPTLVAYPRWVRPIKGLFDILGTLPGYDELDLAPFFMIALPLFAAMLIGDAGYGLLFVLGCLLFGRRLRRSAGPEKVNLLLIVGIATLVWGVLTTNYFGITPQSLAEAGGYGDCDAMVRGSDAWAAAGRLMLAPAVLWVPEPPPAAPGSPAPWNPRDVIIAVSFILGTLHLVAAHLRQLLRYFPDQRWLAELGWCLILVAMLGIIWLLFYQGKATAATLMPLNVNLGLLVVGAVLAVGFSVPDRNPLRRVGVGLAASLLPLLGTFSDTMSYIRLMAVGLASYYIASAFNGLGAMLGELHPLLWLVGGVIIVFGHALNIGLAAIAIFAHGVRLNMLEFSNNAGVQWTGYAYQPFARLQTKER